MVLYNIPHRDCGLYSAGGASDADAYKEWIRAVAAGIGDRPAVVILEPDALAGSDCLPPDLATERSALIADAVEILTAQPRTDVYIDAGNVTWHPAGEIARRLMDAGIEHAAGFSLNVSNFFLTADSIAFGREISDALALGGTHFVIDTSRNGNGPWESDDPESWCNPPGRALGEPSTVETADPLVDAYLWIKRPGESDGECRGAPEAGAWYPEYALELARNANW
jgi:endoglucanase